VANQNTNKILVITRVEWLKERKKLKKKKKD